MSDRWLDARREHLLPVDLLLHGLPLDEVRSWLRTLSQIVALPETRS